MSPADLSALRIDEKHRSSGSSKVWRWIAIALGIIVILSGALMAFLRKTPEVQVAPVRAATQQNVSTTLLNASGYVTPRRRSTIAAKITGRVEQMFAEEGMRVSPGQVLAILDQTDARVRLESAIAERDAAQASVADLEVNLANAERELRRTQELQKGGISTQQLLDTARTTVESYRAKIALTKQQIRAAEARIGIAKQDLENCIVRAPYAGIVVSKDAQRGEMVSPISAGGGFTRTGIATVVDMTSLEIEVDVNESYIARVREKQPVSATLDAYPDWKIPSHVRTIIPSADRQKATVKVRIGFDELDPRILPDMGVKVAFLEQRQADANAAARLLVPRGAVKEEGGNKFVYLYRDGVVERRAVRIGGENGEQQEVVAGLLDGDQIVVNGMDGLHDGQKVNVRR